MWLELTAHYSDAVVAPLSGISPRGSMSFTPRVEGIASVLSGTRLAVPDYQRSYSWGETQITDFWDDLNRSLLADANEYFLGSIVLTKTASERLAVVDGQQRLATASLLIAAIVDLFEDRADERAGDIRKEVLGKKDVVTRALTQNLQLNVEDNELFRQLTLIPAGSRNIKQTRESHTLLVNAFDVLKGKLAASIDGLGPDDWQIPLTRWYTLLKEKANVLQLSVEDESRAFVIFETLNDRGVGLNTADLLRNHVLSCAEVRIEEAKTGWTAAFAAVSQEGKTEETETFLKQFWASQQGVVRVKGLFKQMKGEVRDAESAVSFVQELREAGPLWSAMYDRDAHLWSRYPSSALDALQVLKQLNVEQCRPLLLAVLRRFSPEDAKRVFQLVMNWSIRWIVAGGGGGGTNERLYAEAARDVTRKTISSVSSLVSVFQDAVPSDAEFKMAFKSKPIQKGWTARYFLRALERTHANTAESELVPNENVEEVNLEHVLPKNPDPAWQAAFPSDTAASYVYLIGNQALLQKSHNKVIGNKPFAEKKPILAASGFELTRNIAANPTWGPDDIQDRSAELAALAVKTWPIRV